MRCTTVPMLGATLALLALPAGATLAQADPFPEIQVGDVIDGTLTPGGPALLELGPFVAYWFQGEVGRRYQADARSPDFDAYLILAHLVGGITDFLLEDDDGGEGADARLRFLIEEPGDYLLIVSAWGDRSGGAFVLSLGEWELPPPATPRPLSLGEAVIGRLTDESQLAITEWGEDVRSDLWTFEGRAGEHYRISMESDDFDTFLDFGAVSGDSLLLTESDDDGGEGTNAMLRVRLPDDGLYWIRARPLGSDSALGTYTLRVDPFTPAPVLRRRIQAGVAVDARLGVDDASLERGIHYQEWVFKGTAGESVRIRMRSDDFDTYLSLGREGVDGSFEELTWNDDAPDDGLNSLIRYRIPEDGEYVIRARSYSGGAEGVYTLEVARDG